MLKIELSWQAAAITSACLLGTTTAIRVRGALTWRQLGPAGAGSQARESVPGPAIAPPHDCAPEIRQAPARAADPVAVGVAARRRHRMAEAVAIIQEAGIVVGLFALWQFAGHYAERVEGGALDRAQWIWHAERVLRLPDEAAVQRLFLPHPLLVEACNLYYASLHFAGLIALLVWVFLRHRDKYPEIRAVLVMLTGTCLLIQLIPVAPPRMLPLDGMIDTGIKYGQSVYGSIAGFNPDELSAMPSVHVAWALLVGITVVRFSASRWRWLALLYPALTSLVVVVTANHFWADGIVAGALLILAMLTYRAAVALARWLRRGPRLPAGVPDRAAGLRSAPSQVSRR
jgi:hypothetical protein